MRQPVLTRPAAVAAALLAVCAVPAPARAQHGAPRADCIVRYQAAGLFVVLTGYARVPATRPAAALALTCTASNRFGSVSATSTAPGALVVAHGVGYLRQDGLTICYEATAYYDSGPVSTSGCFADGCLVDLPQTCPPERRR